MTRRVLGTKAVSRMTVLTVVCGAYCGLAGSAQAATIAYPDLQVQVPTSVISIGHPTQSTKSLQFTHITWNAGAGPLEIRPSYNPATGISQGFQALYSSSGSGTWTFNQTVPIVAPMIWTPPSDYRFQLTKFWLYNVAAGGGIGSLVATSPKVDFCITPDIYVGGVPNTPPSPAYAQYDCTSPTGTLGLDVGWGDQYDATDGGENIDITNVADGTYWLRAEADPYHYFAESNVANNITDTELTITGNRVTVIKQTNPDSTPPTAALSSPVSGTSVSGVVTLTATATGPAPISQVQFLLDGQPLGSPVTAAPYSMSWNIGSTPGGPHYLSVQATDNRGFVGTAADVPITVAAAPVQIGSISVDHQASTTGHSSATIQAFSTSSPSEVLLAFVGSDGPITGQTMSVTGGGLAWTLVKRADANGGDAEIWTATASAPLSNVSITATASKPGYDLALTTAALKGASGIGASAAVGANGGAPTIGLTTTSAGSALFATGNDFSNDVARALGPGQSMLAQSLDASTADTYWTQYASAPSSAAGQSVTLNDTAPTADMFNLVAVEVLPGSSPPPDTQPPTVSIVNPTSGQTVSGTIQVSANASDNVAVKSVQFFLNGNPLGSPVTSPPYATSWNTTTAANGSNTLTATAVDPSGNVGTSSSVTVTVQNPSTPPPCFVMDADVSVNGTTTVTTPSFHTALAGEVLLALAASDGPAGGGHQSVTISGGGLTWTLVKRANTQSGDAEIWQATAAQPLSNVAITSTPAARGYNQSLTVIAMQMSLGVGASVAGSGPSGTPSASLKTTQPGSLVFGVGSDWDSGIPRTVGINQVLLRQWVDTGVGNTFWAQNTTIQSGAAGSSVTLNDTAPTIDQWNMAAVELLGDGPGQ
jgi:hypothetical protein